MEKKYRPGYKTLLTSLTIATILTNARMQNVHATEENVYNEVVTEEAVEQTVPLVEEAPEEAVEQTVPLVEEAPEEAVEQTVLLVGEAPEEAVEQTVPLVEEALEEAYDQVVPDNEDVLEPASLNSESLVYQINEDENPNYTTFNKISIIEEGSNNLVSNLYVQGSSYIEELQNFINNINSNHNVEFTISTDTILDSKTIGTKVFGEYVWKCTNNIIEVTVRNDSENNYLPSMPSLVKEDTIYDDVTKKSAYMRVSVRNITDNQIIYSEEYIDTETPDAVIKRALNIVESETPNTYFFEDLNFVEGRMFIAGDPGFDGPMYNITVYVNELENLYTTKTDVEDIPFETIREYNSSLAAGKEEISQEGMNGKKEIIERIVTVNGYQINREIISESVVKTPTHRVIQVGTKVVEVEQETRTEEVAFDTIRVENPDMLVGEEVESQEGTPGVLTIVEEVTYENGEEVSRVEVSSEVTTDPVDRIIQVGTKVREEPVDIFRHPAVFYRTHVQSFGWQPFVKDGAMSGTSGQAKRLEGIEIKLDNLPYAGGIEYQTHVQSYGWMNWAKNGAMSGTSGEAKRLEGIRIKLTGDLAKHYDVYYRVHAESFGWLDWTKNGEASGTEGLAKRLEGIEVQLVKKGEKAPGATKRPYILTKPSISYTTHVQKDGWQAYVKDGQMAGTSGRALRLEGIKMQVSDPTLTGGIEYRTHVQKIGWQDWKANDDMSGTSGQALRLEAIEIRLTGELAKHYDVYYRVHAESFGWLDWTKNGEASGTEGLAKRLEGIEVQLVKKGEKAPGATKRPYILTKPSISYTTHVQKDGWQAYVKDGQMAGTSGRALRLEGIKMQVSDPTLTGGIEYRTHVQKIGWQNWKANDDMSGTSGQALRLEAIQIRLTGELAKHYDVYYRVHAQSYGWLGWAKSGEPSGTEGLGKRLEGIEVRLVRKGGKAPGNTSRSYIKK